MREPDGRQCPRGLIFVYVSNADSREISVLRLESESGNLTPVERVPVNGTVMPMAVSPDRRFLYAALRSEPYTAISFAIDPSNGTLRFLANAPLADSMAYISTDRSGRFLLCASYPGAKVTVNPIESGGFVKPPHQILACEPNPHAILTDPSNRHALVPSLSQDCVMQWHFDAGTGKLTRNSIPSAHIEAKAGPRHFVFHPNLPFVYLVTEFEGSVRTFAWSAESGTLRQLQSVSALPMDFSAPHAKGADLHLTPDGRFLYVSERVSNTLAGFTVDSVTGLLSRIGNFATEKQPRGFNIDSSGRFVLAVGQLSNSITCHAIDKETGELTVVARHPMGKNPNWVEIVGLS